MACFEFCNHKTSPAALYADILNARVKAAVGLLATENVEVINFLYKGARHFCNLSMKVYM